MTMRVHEAYSLENSALIFSGRGAMNALGRAVDYAHQIPKLTDSEAIDLSEIAERLEDPEVMSSKIASIEEGQELNLIMRGLRIQINETNTRSSLRKHIQTLRATKLERKILRATG